MTELPAWAQRVNELVERGDGVRRWCGLCGIPEGHPVHDRAATAGELVDVSDAEESALLSAAQLPRHRHIDGSEGLADGRCPKHGEMRMPGWHTLHSFQGVPLLEGY